MPCSPLFSISASDIADPHRPNRASTVLFPPLAHLDLSEANKEESGFLLFSVVVSDKSTRTHRRQYPVPYIAHVSIKSFLSSHPTGKARNLQIVYTQTESLDFFGLVLDSDHHRLMEALT